MEERGDDQWARMGQEKEERWRTGSGDVAAACGWNGEAYASPAVPRRRESIPNGSIGVGPPPMIIIMGGAPPYSSLFLQ